MPWWLFSNQAFVCHKINRGSGYYLFAAYEPELIKGTQFINDWYLYTEGS